MDIRHGILETARIHPFRIYLICYLWCVHTFNGGLQPQIPITALGTIRVHFPVFCMEGFGVVLTLLACSQDIMSLGVSEVFQDIVTQMIIWDQK